jgi:Major Facilitator Superfamily
MARIAESTSRPIAPVPGSVDRTTHVFLLCNGLRWLPTGFVVPIMALVPTERGLGLPTVGLMFAAHGMTTAVLELPTGGLADVIGRRPVLLIATVAESGLLLALALGTTTWQFLAGGVLGGIGRALSSGPLEAWYVETVRAVDPQARCGQGCRPPGSSRDLRWRQARFCRRCCPRSGPVCPLTGCSPN